MRKIFIILIINLCTSNAYALTRIDITKGNPDPLPIAVKNIEGEREDEKHMGLSITKIIESDLNNSGLFRIIDKAAYTDYSKGDALPNFISWRGIDAQGLVIGSTKIIGENLEVSFRLWDPFSEKTVSWADFYLSESWIS